MFKSQKSIMAAAMASAARDEQRQRERADNHFGAVAMDIERLSRRGRPVAQTA